MNTLYNYYIIIIIDKSLLRLHIIFKYSRINIYSEHELIITI